MTFPAGQDDIANVCPYLGLADDADSHATYPTEAHRCYRLENPTRIATGHQDTYCLGANHVTCPVFRGEGIGATRPATGAAAGAAAAAGAPGADAPRRGPRPPRDGGRREPAGAGRGGSRSPALERRRPTGTLGPRPRSGGISMPVATIGLFALAIVVLTLALFINRMVGGGDDNGDLSQADRSASQFARTATQPAGGSDQTPAAGETPDDDEQPDDGDETPAGGSDDEDDVTPPAGGGQTYTVEADDFCGTIAAAHDLTLDEFLDLNPEIDEGCTNLRIGQEVRVR